jgi:hypothetical protein
MDYRQGKCSACGAEYKIPASFQHNAAKCKECGGVVSIGPVTSARSSGPVPARQFAGKRPEEAEKKTGGTLERLKAQRAPSEAPKPPKPSGTLDKLKAERAAAAAKPAAAAAPPPVHSRGATLADRTRGSKRRASASARKHGGGDDGEDGASPGRRGAHHRGQKKPPFALIGISVVALIVAGGASYLMFKNEADTQAKEPDPKTAQAPDPGAEASADPGVDDATSGTEDVPAGDSEAAGDKPADAPVAPKEKAPKEPEKGDPSAVDLLAYPDFPAPTGTSPAEWTELNDLVSAFLADDGARSSRALRSLEASGPRAVPAMLNRMKHLNLGEDHDYAMCSSLQRALTEIAHGKNFGWYNGQEDTPHYQNKRVVENWIKRWTQANEDIEAWIRFTELDTKAPEEATQLRETFAREGAAVIKKDDDLDVD